MKVPIDVEDLTEYQLKNIVNTLLESLDKLDSKEYFGKEGWRHFLDFEN